MSYIGAIALIVTPNVYSGFILFHNIISKSALFSFYEFDESYMKQRIIIFKQILGFNLQELCFHFEDEGLQPNLYLYEWFMSLFSKTLNVDITCRVWDLILLEGIHILYKTAIAIFKTLQDDLLDADFDEIMVILKKSQEMITDEEDFVNKI